MCSHLLHLFSIEKNPLEKYRQRRGLSVFAVLFLLQELAGDFAHTVQEQMETSTMDNSFDDDLRVSVILFCAKFT